MPPCESEQPSKVLLAVSKSPKSEEFPVVAIVMKSILFTIVGAFKYPPANNPRTEFEVAAIELLSSDAEVALDKFPKS